MRGRIDGVCLLARLTYSTRRRRAPPPGSHRERFESDESSSVRQNENVNELRASPAVLQNKSQFAILTKMIGSILPLAVKIVVISIGSK